MSKNPLNTSLDVSRAMMQKASSLAAKEGIEVQNAIATIIKAKEDWEGGPFTVLLAMTSNYGEDIHEFPDPMVETGNNPGKFDRSEPKKGGGTTRKTYDFYRVFTEQTKEGAPLVREREFLKRLEDENDNKEGMEPAFVTLYGSNPQVRAERRGVIDRRLSVMVNAYKRAIRLMYQLEKAATLFDDTKLSIRPLWANKEMTAVQQVSKPIIAEEPAFDLVSGRPVVPAKWKHLGVNAFLNLDFDKVVDGGGTFDALLKALERETKSSPEESNLKPQHIGTLETFKARFRDIHEFLDNVFEDKDRAKYQAVLKALNGPGSDALLLEMATVRDMLSDFLRHDKLRARADILKENVILSDEKESAAA